MGVNCPVANCSVVNCPVANCLVVNCPFSEKIGLAQLSSRESPCFLCPVFVIISCLPFMSPSLLLSLFFLTSFSSLLHLFFISFISSFSTSFFLFFLTSFSPYFFFLSILTSFFPPLSPRPYFILSLFLLSLSILPSFPPSFCSCFGHLLRHRSCCRSRCTQ